VTDRILRLRRFLRMAYESRSLWLRSPVDRHNLRALWFQADPDWLSKLEPIDLTDDEWKMMQEAMR
jgi:hypothetical protein